MGNTEEILKKYGVKIKYFHPINDIKNFEKKINQKTKLIYLESPGTATFDIIDIPLITKIAKKNKNVHLLGLLPNKKLESLKEAFPLLTKKLQCFSEI